MASIKFISTTLEKLNEIPVETGQVIFVQDQRAIYLDADTRTSYQQIITLQTEAQRQALPYPLNGYYFVVETAILWSYNNGWIAITSSPDDRIIFGPYDTFPEEGVSNALYIDGTSMYRYIDGDYQLLNGSMSWGSFN